MSDTDVEKADRSKYGVARRSIWYILRFVLIASVVVTLCYAALMEAMYVSNIYIIVTEGMEMRADCILGNKSKAELTEHFTESWLQEDEAVNGNKYSLYRVDSYDHRLEIEKFRVWPWSKEATLQVVERVPNIQATPYSSDTTDPVPSWVAGRDEINVDKFDGRLFFGINMINYSSCSSRTSKFIPPNQKSSAKRAAQVIVHNAPFKISRRHSINSAEYPSQVWNSPVLHEAPPADRHQQR